ncbi:MAG TPA: TonB family protein [Terriglobales bacterium]|nr:TonB family protein [Terriglobales bacterium]
MWQRQGSALRVDEVDEAAEPVSAPTLLLRLEPRGQAFWSNFADLFGRRQQPPLKLISWPAAPWPDVFVPTRWPWKALSESLFLHLAVIAGVFWLVPLWPHRDVVVQHSAFQKEDIIYYSPSEYLPPLDTGSAHLAQPQKGEPAYAPQPIISVPAEADNRTQTIVTPPDIKLNRDVALPNIVAWSPASVAVPIAATTRTDLRVPSLIPQTVVAPAPDVSQASQRQAPNLQANVTAPAPEVNNGLQRRGLLAPEASVVAPAPQMDSALRRNVGDINIGHSDVVAPAPQLSVSEQHTTGARARGLAGNSGGGPAVAAPPPSMSGVGSSRTGGGQVIALSVRPAPPNAAEAIPSGNRRGTFAAGPQGKSGAAGTPDVPATKDQAGSGVSRGQGNGNGAGNTTNANGAPPGLMVGTAPKNAPTSAIAGGNTADNKLTASLTPPRLTTPGRNAAKEVSPENATPLERKIFGDRKFYSMTLNLPNLNSAGGSWVFRFAEMQASKEQGELNGPGAIQTVDPAYPAELMRKNVQGTVVLYAVIHDDGTVGQVRVLDSVNDRLDEYARAALLQWRFRPASKNGNNVTVEAVVRVPFKPFRF